MNENEIELDLRKEKTEKEKQKLRNMNTTALAYMGDAVYESRIREMLLRTRPLDIGHIHHEAVQYVSSDGQATAIKSMMKNFLTEEEIRLVKRARNRRMTSRPKNANPRKYKLATGFEALLGYLYLARETDRLNAVMNEAIRVIEEDKHE